MLYEIDAFKNVINFTGKHLCWSFSLIIMQGKETSAQVFSCGIFKNFKNTFLAKTSGGRFCAIDRLLAEKISSVFLILLNAKYDIAINSF